MHDVVSQAVWRRLDAEGHDACRLLKVPEGWRLAGHCLFIEEGIAGSLAYRVDCNEQWRTRQASVSGWRGDADIELQILAQGGCWRVNGEEQPLAAGLIDLDLSFTPATNLIPLRRLALALGQTSEAPAAYLALPRLTLGRLDQSYQRLDESRYRYAAPVFEFATVLTFSPGGFVGDYPPLWAAAT